MKFDPDCDDIRDLIATVPRPTTEMVNVGMMALEDYYNGTKDAPVEGSLAHTYRAMSALDDQRAEKDEAYRQRNYLVAALARLFPSGIRATNIEGWSPDWHGCVYIDLPTGQISYHYHDSHAFLFSDLPPYEKEWDGHDKETVHARLIAIRADNK